MDITKCLTISSVHVTQETIELLGQEAQSNTLDYPLTIRNCWDVQTMADRGKWVHAANQLPALRKPVLVFQPGRKSKQKVFEAFLSKGFYGDKKEHWLSTNAFSGGGSSVYTVDEITHWTMLPNPPIDGEESNWIPFTEDAKEMLSWMHSVLIFVPDSPYSHNLHQPVVTTSFFRNGDWYGCYGSKDVTHWMPLPKPPKEDAK